MSNNMTITVEGRATPTHRWWHAPWEFAVRAVVGILIFVVIALAAVALELVLQTLEAAHVNRGVILGLRAAEYAIFVADLVTFLVFIWRTTIRTIARLR